MDVRCWLLFGVFFVTAHACNDRHRYCQSWATAGYCRTNQYVRENCCGSCERQANVCYDKKRYCQYWARKGYCETDNYVIKQCCKSCKKKGYPKTTAAPVTSPTTKSGPRVIPKSHGCWKKCGNNGGSCPKVCGKNGYCCRKGFLDCPSDLADLVAGPHACVVVPDGPYLIAHTLGCWKKCGNKGGSCPSICGKNGFCCRKNYDDCPKKVSSANPYAQHACVRVPGSLSTKAPVSITPSVKATSGKTKTAVPSAAPSTKLPSGKVTTAAPLTKAPPSKAVVTSAAPQTNIPTKRVTTAAPSAKVAPSKGATKAPSAAPSTNIPTGKVTKAVKTSATNVPARNATTVAPTTKVVTGVTSASPLTNVTTGNTTASQYKASTPSGTPDCVWRSKKIASGASKDSLSGATNKEECLSQCLQKKSTSKQIDGINFIEGMPPRCECVHGTTFVSIHNTAIYCKLQFGLFF